MTVTDKDPFLAILAMDTYNRGYGAGLNDDGANDQDGLGVSGSIGTAKIAQDSSILLEASGNRLDQAAGFYAVAYKDASGNIVISYCGTDDPTIGADVNAWMGGAGFQTAQARMAAQFYSQVREDYPSATITLTGHSLGRGLAGWLGARRVPLPKIEAGCGVNPG